MHVALQRMRRQAADPVASLGQTALARDVEQALRRIRGCQRIVAGGQRMPRGVLQLAVVGEPGGRPFVIHTAFFRRQLVELPEQEIACHRVQAQPVATLALGHQRRLAGEPLQVRGCLGTPRHGLADLRVDHFEYGDADQERGLVRRQSRQQRLEEIPVNVAAPGAQLADHFMQVDGPLDGCRRQLQSERPAFGDLMQAHRVVECDPLPEPGAQHLERFVEAQAQVTGIELGHPPGRQQVGQLQLERTTRADQELQVRRRVVEQVSQQLPHRVLRHAMRVIEDDHRGRRKLGNRGEQRGQRIEFAVGLHHVLRRGQRE